MVITMLLKPGILRFMTANLRNPQKSHLSNKKYLPIQYMISNSPENLSTRGGVILKI